jgi:hypothetical protein
MNLGASFQTELAIDTNTTVTGTHAMVTDTRITVADTHTMVADIHRTVLTGREGTSGKNHSVGQLTANRQHNAYHPLDSSQVSSTNYNRAILMIL